ncbi:Nitronate monooxygenase [bioreactor metagenome]|uniref:Nitronate monooxygenase n=1 Tax=bioreactor metagenome TaxID=1076179 RepID=A0A644W832_9ZZZZ
MIKTRFTELLGIQYPIMQGGMQHLGVAAFASAVSNAGGLGTINISCFPDPDSFREELIRMKALTVKPFAVNISLLPELTKGDEIKRYIEICGREKVAALEVSGGDPSQFMPAIKGYGIKLIHKSPSIKIARRMVEKGADIITIIGYEVAGHPSMDGIGTIVMANRAASLLDVPVLAAGGIADGKGLAAALSLGCEGVVMGTRLVATAECPISQNHKNWIVDHSERDSVLILKSIKNMMRTANNETARQCIGMEQRGAALPELMPLISGKRGKESYLSGNVEESIFCVGPAMGLINGIPSVQELLDGMVAEAQAIIRRLQTQINPGE